MAKQRYQVRNWNQYNKALKERGSITFWFSEEVIEHWQDVQCSKKRGRRMYFSEMAICCGLTLRQLFRLPLRATEGLLRSLSEWKQLSLRIPDYTTLCRRSGSLKISFKGFQSVTEARHVLVDSTGIQVLGEGEWKVWKHGQYRRKIWRKLHLAIDADRQMILSAAVSESQRHDGNYLPPLIDAIEGEIRQMTGDGAYDKKACYRVAYKRKAKAVFPPQRDAIVQRNKIRKDPALGQRDATIRFILEGEDREAQRKRWKIENNYHRRSLAETMMWRMKSIFGDQMRSKTLENQQTDLLLRCIAMNRMTALGMPISVPR